MSNKPCILSIKVYILGSAAAIVLFEKIVKILDTNQPPIANKFKLLPFLQQSALKIDSYQTLN